MLGSVGPGVQFAFHCRAETCWRLHQGVHRVDAHVQIVLYLVEVAVVLVCDLLRDVAFGYSVHILGRHIQRTDYGGQGIIDALPTTIREITLMLGCVGAGVQFAFTAAFVSISASATSAFTASMHCSG